VDWIGQSVEHGGAEVLDSDRPSACIADLYMTPYDGQAIECFVVGLKIQMQVGIRMPQDQSFPSIASPFVSCDKLQALPGRSAGLLHSGIGRIFAAAEKRCLYSRPLQRFVRRLDTNRQEQMLSEPPFRNGKLKLQLTGIP
jgi:hypothetical protein